MMMQTSRLANKSFQLVPSVAVVLCLAVASMVEAGEPRTEVTLRPAMNKEGELEVVFYVQPASYERLVLTAMTLEIEAGSINADSANRSHVYGWYVSQRLGTDVTHRQNQLWLGTVVPPQDVTAKLSVTLPAMLQSPGRLGESLCLYVELGTEGLPHYIEGSSQKTVFAPITSIHMKPANDLQVKSQSGWIPTGVHELAWKPESDVASAHLRIEFEKAGPGDDAMLLLVAFFTPFATGAIVTMRIVAYCRKRSQYPVSTKWFSVVAVFVASVGIVAHFVSYLGSNVMLGGFIACALGIAIGPHIRIDSPVKDILEKVK